MRRPVPRTSSPARPQRTRHVTGRGAAAWAAAGGIVAGCVVAGCSATGISVVDTDSPTWSVVVSDPRFSAQETCSDDPSVETALMSADMPSSGLGISLVAGATSDDAHRVAACLDEALDSGVVTIMRPR